MVGSLEPGRAHGPATRATAHTQQRARNRGRARPEQRTGHGLDYTRAFTGILAEGVSIYWYLLVNILLVVITGNFDRRVNFFVTPSGIYT